MQRNSIEATGFQVLVLLAAFARLSDDRKAETMAEIQRMADENSARAQREGK